MTLRESAIFRFDVWTSIHIIFAAALCNVMALGLPLTLMQVYDRLLPHHAIASTFWLTVGCVFSIALEVMCRFAKDQLTTDLGYRFEAALATTVFSKIVNSCKADFRTSNVTDKIEIMTAVKTLRGAYCGQFLTSLVEIPFCLLYVGVVYYIDAHMGLFLVGLLVLIIAFSTVLRLVLEDGKDHKTNQNIRGVAFIMETLSKIHVIKSFALEERVLRRYERIAGERTYLNLRNDLLNNIPNVSNIIFSQVAVLGVIVFGAGNVINREVTLGVVTACMIISGRAIQPILNLMSYWVKTPETNAARDRIEVILNEPVSILERTKADRPANGEIVLTDVTFRFANSKESLFEKLNWTAPARKTIAITQSHGNGASTLLYLIAGLFDPTSGEVRIDGNITNRHMLERGMAYISAYSSMFKGTVLENIAGFSEENYQTAMEVAELLNLDEEIAELSHGFGTHLDRESNFTLPRSFIQKLSLARALVKGPRILLIDKLDTAFDRDDLHVFRRALYSKRKNATIIIITDNRSILNLADKIYRIENRTMIEVSKSEILAKRPVSEGEAA